MTPVRFTKHHGRYNSGEVAGFPDAEAAELVAAGVASPLNAPAADEEAAEPSDPMPKPKAARK
ncbi:hypothetical protein LV780_04860 [Cereibacter azotoformans]|uniref:hypothetical protein n=1 Tax=Cereibacter azotoformans TaxID=43057 RepID=UPI000E358A8F|nr:hypothetical protein [Cereibacter azotoformans]AXQ93200.1 hypothetical protein D0Z66_04850 [Cereibacter sphaeroides]UIJ31511.1 hypothetical protein LV780_04860 [Cereibacter azotoformans]